MGTQAAGKCFHSFFEFSQNFHKCLYNLIETHVFYFRKHHDEKKENNLLALIIKMQILFARIITTSTAHASSVSPSSYTNTIINQSVRVLS